MAGGSNVCGCVVRCGQTRAAAARVNLSYPHGGGVLMAFAMALNREDDCKSDVREFIASVLPSASSAVTCGGGLFEAVRCPITLPRSCAKRSRL